jgi:hypothetical protein
VEKIPDGTPALTAPSAPLAASGAAAAGMVRLRVMRKVLNRRIVLATDAAEEMVWRVRVKDSGRVRVGMVLECKVVSGSLAQLIGKLPRKVTGGAS